MDKVIYTAMSAASQALDQQAVINHNLANVSTHGFRAQLMEMRAVPVLGDGVLPTRVSVATTTPGTDFSPGPVSTTGRALDIAINGDGWLAVQDPAGNEAYTRRGDLEVDGNGLMLSGGHPVIGESGPIVLPLGANIFIGNDGVISVIPEGQDAKDLVQIDRLKLVERGNDALLRGPDGLFRPVADEGQAQILPRGEVTVISGALEGSNMSAVESMVAMIDNARRYDMQMKIIESASENAQRGNTLLSLQ